MPHHRLVRSRHGTSYHAIPCHDDRLRAFCPKVVHELNGFLREYKRGVVDRGYLPLLEQARHVASCDVTVISHTRMHIYIYNRLPLLEQARALRGGI